MKRIEIIDFNEPGYKPLVAYNNWRVAMLNYIDELETMQIDNFQAHLETDETFILLSGKCILFLGDKKDGRIANINAIDMEPHKIYNIKKGVYHTHTLKEDSKVLIVENDDTSDDNSPKVMIDQEINHILTELKEKVWTGKSDKHES
ncbi:MAG: hypothetical protein UMR38_04455 [Candidatus Izemoplasma sp.]|nr:hypothetical protein [Candidatus Izemoplasma sp.]